MYDAVEELREWGLVDVRDASPREFWAVSVETASGTFQRERRQRTAVLTEAPGVGAVPPPQEGSVPPAGRVLVDGTTTLVSVFDGDSDGNPGAETAIWGVGETNSLVVVLTALFDC